MASQAASIVGAALADPAADQAFFAALEAAMPACAEITRRPEGAEDPAFVRAAVAQLIAMIEVEKN